MEKNTRETGKNAKSTGRNRKVTRKNGKALVRITIATGINGIVIQK